MAAPDEVEIEGTSSAQNEITTDESMQHQLANSGVEDERESVAPAADQPHEHEAAEAQPTEGEPSHPEAAQVGQHEEEDVAVKAQVESVSLEAYAMRIGIIVYHKLTGTRYDLTCTIKQGNRQITIDGVPIEELIERNCIAPIAPLLERMRSERLSSYDVDIAIGGLEWSQHINPLVMGYALWQALDNILSRL